MITTFQPTTFATAPPPHVVVVPPPVQPVPPRKAMEHVMGVATIATIGIFQLILGIVMVGVQIAALIFAHREILFSNSQTGPGIWCGALVVICGILGMCAASTKTDAMVISFLVFNVLCLTIFSPVMMGSMGVDLSLWRLFWEYPNKEPMTAMASVMLADAILVFCFSLWGMIVSSIAINKARACGACCCPDPLPPQSSTYVMAGTQQQVPVVMQGQNY